MLKQPSALGALALVATALFVQPASSQSFELSGKAYKMTWPNGGWNGKHAFPGVYCLAFPSPGIALDLTHAMYNKGSIYLTSVLYPDNLIANVAVSTVPAGRTAEEEVARERAIPFGQAHLHAGQGAH